MTKDLTSGSPLKVILLFSLPLVLGNLFQQFYALADTIIVGRFCGVSALASVGATGSVNYLILGLSLASATALQSQSRSCSARGITVICAAMWPTPRGFALRAAWC